MVFFFENVEFLPELGVVDYVFAQECEGERYEKDDPEGVEGNGLSRDEEDGDGILEDAHDDADKDEFDESDRLFPESHDPIISHLYHVSSGWMPESLFFLLFHQIQVRAKERTPFTRSTVPKVRASSWNPAPI